MLLSYRPHGDMGCFLSLSGFIISLSGGKAPSHLVSRKERRFEFGEELISLKKTIKNKKRSWCLRQQCL